MPDDAIKRALRAHAATVDSTVLRFVTDLNRVVAEAQHRLGTLLLQKLTFNADKIAATPVNQKILRKVPQLWQQALDDAGLEVIVHRYLESFPAQIPAFHEILAAVNESAKEPLPIPKFTSEDLAYFRSLSLSAAADVSAIVEHAAATLISKTVYALGALSFRDLVETLVKTTDVSKPRAEGLADTALQSFYRSVAGVGHDKIQAKLTQPLTFKYTNPRDQVTRKWCRDMLDKDLAYTKAEIMQLSNGTEFPPLTFCGGMRCRGNWLVQPLSYSVS